MGLLEKKTAEKFERDKQRADEMAAAITAERKQAQQDERDAKRK